MSDSNGTRNGSQWTWQWIGGLVIAGILVFSVQRVLSYDSRIQVMEAEKGYILDRLERMDAQLDRMEAKIDTINRNNGARK